jgi:hypothetical protein
MKAAEVFQRWAPPGCPWSPWVKPVLFAHFAELLSKEAFELDPPPTWLESDVIKPLLEQTLSADKAQHPYRSSTKLDDVAIVVDLPGSEGVVVGVALAGHGFQPVPLYNALPAKASMVVDQRPIMKALVSAAPALTSPSDRAPPAFLLDANRMNHDRFMAGAFDNRSVSFVSDFPSAAKLVGAGIRRAVLLQSDDEPPSVDLSETLELWRKAGVEIFLKPASVPGPPQPCARPRAPFLSRLLYRLERRQFGRHPDGTFGKLVPALPPPGSGWSSGGG